MEDNMEQGFTTSQEENIEPEIAAEDQLPPETDTEEDVLAQVQAKADDYYKQLQRLQAEFDNYRKRTQKEKEDLSKYASERVIVSLLPILDNMERAMEAAQKTGDLSALKQGQEMIYKQFWKAMEEEGLKAIESVGHDFDFNLHEAVMREEADAESNTILMELRKGYFLKDKVIRYSQVKVAD